MTAPLTNRTFIKRTGEDEPAKQMIEVSRKQTSRIRVKRIEPQSKGRRCGGNTLLRVKSDSQDLAPKTDKADGNLTVAKSKSSSGSNPDLPY